MSYYTLYKNNHLLDLDVLFEKNNTNINPYISNSIFYYKNDILNQINKLSGSGNLKNIYQLVNTYSYIYNKIPNTNYSISKIQQKTEIFFDFIEIFNTLNLFHGYENGYIKTLSISENTKCVSESYMFLRNNINDFYYNFTNFNDIINIFSNINNNNIFDLNSIHFLFYDNINNKTTNNNIYELIYFLKFILFFQHNNGNTIIKIKDIHTKITTDIIYFLTNIYDKVFIVKPFSSNILSDDKYIICNKYICNNIKLEKYETNLDNIIKKIEHNKNKNIYSIINQKLPYYFINKMEEINILIGNQQIEAYDLIINILKHKNKDEKIDNIKKNNILKSIKWCETYNVPYNKNNDKYSEKNNDKNYCIIKENMKQIMNQHILTEL